MRVVLTALTLVLCGWLGAASAADENLCAKMNGQERAACEKQQSLAHDKAHAKEMSEKMRGQGAKEKGQGAEKGNADHDSHATQGAKSKAKP